MFLESVALIQLVKDKRELMKLKKQGESLIKRGKKNRRGKKKNEKKNERMERRMGEKRKRTRNKKGLNMDLNNMELLDLVEQDLIAMDESLEDGGIVEVVDYYEKIRLEEEEEIRLEEKGFEVLAYIS